MQALRTRTGIRRWIAGGAVLALALAACGGDDDDAADDGGAAAADTGAADSDGGGDDGGGDDGGGDAGAGSGGGGGTLVLGAETISLDSARCFLEEQDAAAGGGKILFVAQATGTNAEGEEVLIDVSRYDEDSQFAGDDILVDVGDVFSGESVGWSAREEIGAVSVDGRTVSADGLTFSNFDEGVEEPGSFEINC